MKIHAFARSPHLAEHLAPIHSHLPDELRGEFLVDRMGRAPKHWPENDVVLVASFLDIASARGRKVIYVEHGAGQRYVGGNPAAQPYYHGGQHPENVIGYISPRQDVADSWGRPAFAAGSPVCDPYELFSTERVAAITLHWNGAPPHKVGVPEAGTAFEHYVDRMSEICNALQDNGYEVLAHHHPRFTHMRSVWTRLGYRVAPVEEVRRRAQLLIADNTSLMYEMLYLYRDVIALNAPWFRRDVEHGLRFWSHAPSMVNDADELIECIDRELFNTPTDTALCEYVYGKRRSDGHDGLRAAAWITTLVSSI